MRFFEKQKYLDVAKEQKGIAGLNILLSLVSMLFLIGIIIMVFVISAQRLQDSITDADAIAVINATKTSLDDVVDWFPTFIVLGAMVVLILLVVIIIQAIRGSGITGGA